MKVLVLALLLIVALVLAGCGNNRGRQEWDGFRDTINRPFQ